MTKPAFITFTGFDENTDLYKMATISELYPVEWAVLFSPDRAGQFPRFPSLSHIDTLIRFASDHPKMTLSAHFCGGYSDQLLIYERSDLEPLLGAFARVQINTAAKIMSAREIKLMKGAKPDSGDEDLKAPVDARIHVDVDSIAEWADEHDVHPILQSRSLSFPVSDKVLWLYDTSGGRGRLPASWPKQSRSNFVGYAGGIDPENVTTAVKRIGNVAKDYWIDMETGVRTDDRFDLSKVAAVCAQVFDAY